MHDCTVCYTVTLYYLTTFQLMELSRRAMARDVEESSHRTAFNSIHFMALKRTIKRSQTENRVQSKHEGVLSSICDLCLILEAPTWGVAPFPSWRSSQRASVMVVMSPHNFLMASASPGNARSETLCECSSICLTLFSPTPPLRASGSCRQQK